MGDNHQTPFMSVHNFCPCTRNDVFVLLQSWRPLQYYLWVLFNCCLICILVSNPY